MQKKHSGERERGQENCSKCFMAREITRDDAALIQFKLLVFLDSGGSDFKHRSLLLFANNYIQFKGIFWLICSGIV